MTRSDASRAWALQAVSKSFGAADVLSGFDVAVHPGEVIALMGVNGAGKTTIARLLLGLETPDAGEVSRPAGARCAAVFQENRLCEHLSAVENVRLVLDRSRWGEVGAELEAVGLPADSHSKPVADLSGGQQRRVAIARALAPRAGLLVLDEPFAGVDVETKPALVACVRERIGGSAVVLITHDAAEAEALGARVVRVG